MVFVTSNEWRLNETTTQIYLILKILKSSILSTTSKNSVTVVMNVDTQDAQRARLAMKIANHSAISHIAALILEIDLLFVTTVVWLINVVMVSVMMIVIQVHET